MTKYIINFYLPDSRECSKFESETPFHSVHVGDEIVGLTWKHAPFPRDEIDPIAKVTKVVHALATTSSGNIDTVSVYTAPL